MAYSEFSKPGVKVQAEQVEEQRSVITPNGPITAEAGDWELRYEDGNVRKLTDEEFQDEFGDATSGDDSADTAVSDVGETGTDDDGESESTVDDNGDSSDKSPAEVSPGKEAESDEATRRPAPPPPTRRR